MIPISDSELRRKTRPYVNISIIVVCAVVFVYQWIMGHLDETVFIYKYGVIPIELTQGISLGVENTDLGLLDLRTPLSDWLSIFTSMFIHGGFWHFFFNMLFLWVFGDNIEDRFGHLRYLLFYLAAGFVAVWLQVATDMDSVVPIIGASGAIAGVLGAYMLLYPYSRVTTLVLFFFVRIPALALLLFWFVFQFFQGVGALLPSTEGGVAYWAHVGGFLLGVVVAVLYKVATKQKIWPRGPGGTFHGGGGEQPEVKYWRGRRL